MWVKETHASCAYTSPTLLYPWQPPLSSGCMKPFFETEAKAPTAVCVYQQLVPLHTSPGLIEHPIFICMLSRTGSASKFRAFLSCHKKSVLPRNIFMSWDRKNKQKTTAFHNAPIGLPQVFVAALLQNGLINTILVERALITVALVKLVHHRLHPMRNDSDRGFPRSFGLSEMA